MKQSTLCKVLFSVAALFVTERFCRLQTDGFRLAKATTSHTYPFQQVSEGSPKQLHQPFYYLGSGVQSYVFLGEDNETILKLFKHHHFGPSVEFCKWALPKCLSKTIVKKREKRMQGLFESAFIAYDKLASHTGVFYLHLGKSTSALGNLPIYDKLGILHHLDLDQTEFILQHKAETVENRLHSLLSQGKVTEAISSMKDLLALIQNRSKKGIKNKDGNVLENCGFLDKQPLEIDIGSFIYRTNSSHPNPHKKTAIRATLKLLGFIKKHYPQYLFQCRQELLYENIS